MAPAPRFENQQVDQNRVGGLSAEPASMTRWRTAPTPKNSFTRAPSRSCGSSIRKEPVAQSQAQPAGAHGDGPDHRLRPVATAAADRGRRPARCLEKGHGRRVPRTVRIRSEDRGGPKLADCPTALYACHLAYDAKHEMFVTVAVFKDKEQPSGMYAYDPKRSPGPRSSRRMRSRRTTIGSAGCSCATMRSTSASSERSTRSFSPSAMCQRSSLPVLIHTLDKAVWWDRRLAGLFSLKRPARRRSHQTTSGSLCIRADGRSVRHDPFQRRLPRLWRRPR